MSIVRRTALTLLPLAAIAILAGGASAQIASGRSGTSTAEWRNNVQAFGDLTAFGRCLVRSGSTSSFALLATDPGSREETALFDRLVFREEEPCLAGGTRMTLSIIYARGSIAEALLETRAEVPDALRLPAPGPTGARDLGGVARCYAGAHRAEVQALLATPAGSAEELAAVSTLWTGFRTCFPPNFNVRLNAHWIRYLLAEALLRLPPAA